jgi:hypothetical protein
MPSEMVPFRTVQIIAGALILGVLIFAVISIVTAQGQPAGLEVIAYIAVAFSVMEAIVSFVAPALVANRRLKELRERTGEIPVMDLFGVYQTQIIIRGALLEGGAFFCCIAYMSTQLWWTLATALVLVAIIAIFFPTRGRFDDWVREQRELQSLSNNFG